MSLVTADIADLVPAGGESLIPGAELTSTGLHFSQDCSESQLDLIGRQLASIEGGVQWWIGDYWNYRQSHGWGCGPEIAERLGLNYKTAYQYASVASRYQFSIRIENLSFGHHQAIAYEEPVVREELLHWCDANRDDKGRSPGISKLKAERNRRLLDSNEYREAQELAGTYDVIVIDPPWDMTKIDRGVRPNQRGFDYPTMTEDELCQLNLPAADHCHLWVWTTHKHLPTALRLVDAWGFTYVCNFVWHKPGGFQPVGLPQYNCEFAIYCRKGSPVFVETVDFSVCFDAPRGSHSEKPEQFYELLRRVTAGRRLDIFNRRDIDGFEGWGNEALD